MITLDFLTFVINYEHGRSYCIVVEDDLFKRERKWVSSCSSMRMFVSDQCDRSCEIR